MRTTKALIDEMADFAKGRRWKFLCIVISNNKGHFDQVFHDDPKALAVLSRSVREGGQPIGLLGFEVTPDHGVEDN